jgi:GNAT superfamily N-acetyltransferase
MHYENYRIRKMTRNQIDIAVEWAAKEGWNPGLHDADCYYAADPDGFFIGLRDDEPIATFSAVKYGESYGFSGFYIVKPEHRGKGYGIQIWYKAAERASRVSLENTTLPCPLAEPEVPLCYNRLLR